MESPFHYFKKPATIKEAQSNINYWTWVKLGGCPDNEVKANWNTYIRSMEYSAKMDLDKLKGAE